MSKEESKSGATLVALLDRDVREIITNIGRFASDFGNSAYLVGGVVRDLYLGQTGADLDFLIEGDAPVFLKALCAHWGELFPSQPLPKKPIIFERYRTAKLPFAREIFPGLKMLEFASTRSESYPIPGGRPELSPADLTADLARRDFSINAMAIALDSGDFALIDLHGGQKDIERKLLNVLHDKSFVDDPARLLRALRFSARIGFALGDETRALFENAVMGNALDTLPKGRLLDEFRKLLSERNPGAVLELMEKTQLLQQVHPSLSYEPGLAQKLASCTDWHTRFRSLFEQLNDVEFNSVLEHFGVNEKEKRQFRN